LYRYRIAFDSAVDGLGLPCAHIQIWSIAETLCGNRTFCANIGVRSDERIAGMLYLGYYDQAPKPKTRTPAVRKMTWL
jgi:hypothetical protein